MIIKYAIILLDLQVFNLNKIVLAFIKYNYFIYYHLILSK